MRSATFGVTPSEKWLLINVTEGGGGNHIPLSQSLFHCFTNNVTLIKKRQKNTDNICYDLGFNIYVCVLLDVTLSTEIAPQKQTLNIIFVK